MVGPPSCILMQDGGFLLQGKEHVYEAVWEINEKSS